MGIYCMLCQIGPDCLYCTRRSRVQYEESGPIWQSIQYIPYCIGAHDMTVLLYTIMLSRSAIDILAKTATIVSVNWIADKLAQISKADL